MGDITYMSKFEKLNLQLFAEGGEGGDGATAENSVDSAQQELLALGVPKDKIRKAKVKAPSTPIATEVEEKQTQGQVATAENPSEGTKTDKPKRMSWDEIMADEEYNKEMQKTIQSRLRNAKSSEETLNKVMPTLELLARKYGQDPAKIDFEALNKAVNDDNDYYENRALELGVPIEQAKKIDQQERETARQQAIEQRTLEQQKIENHIRKLEQQGEQMKKVFPNFDLRRELQNPTFARLTAPSVGLSVEDAYYAVHRAEIDAARNEVVAQKTAQKISASIQAGQRRPMENGMSAQAPSVTTFDYSKASKEQREALKRQIRLAAAKGEKVFPQ